MARAQARFSARVYFCLGRHELPDEFRVLVVNHAAVGGAEETLLFFLRLLLLFLLIHGVKKECLLCLSHRRPR